MNRPIINTGNFNHFNPIKVIKPLIRKSLLGVKKTERRKLCKSYVGRKDNKKNNTQENRR